MTEMVSGTSHDAEGPQIGSDRPEIVRRGLTIDRVYTTAGVHPYDEVTWERRDVVQTNWKTGESVFEQRGVEFPDFWSVIASTIVTTKYFRGAVGTDVREWSLRQLIDRVVKTYRAAGEEHGYFATPADAEVFEHELTWMLLHQVFSFNSPVWFNVGTPAPQQVSACQPYHSLVSTPDGMIPIGRMVEENMIGQKVYDANGLTEVLAVKHNGRKQVLRLTTKSGHQLDVTADHLVWKTTGSGTGAFVPAGELAVGDALSWVRTPIEGIEGADALEVAEAALAGWLQADGFVGQYATGTNRSLTIEAMTVNDDEFDHVLRLVETVFPGAHYKVRDVQSVDSSLRIRRIRLYGELLRPFVTKWGLTTRGVEMAVPEHLFDASAPVVASYVRSIFQAEGFVSRHGATTAHVGLAMISPDIVRGVQSLLGRLGIFSRVRVNVDKRSDRKPTFVLLINNEGDQELFAEQIGFVCTRKQGKLSDALGRGGRAANAVKTLQIAAVETLGEMDVYDIQTSSGEYLSSGNLRVHNCFILAVDDSMASILNWYREEGMIFKGGSGAGLNLSRIRSSKELLSSGGTASGPVSFMRGADASAGTIKSGGATRRAAKMVVLDVDHPDIEEFVETKAREEHKIRALRDAGFDMDLGGKDITSVQYQNANNSVRVSDEFMRAVESGSSFGLRARADGSVIETVDAKGLFDKIAQAAWECADPGIQYDDTINDWHTCPESGRITASNPCSEYMHLDNTSCNLASLNLMKFLREDDTFDAATFGKVVEMVITAMDISICFADFPTEAIGDNTRKFRQLGIGYANLGALLMASGLPYDSDAGRALAAAITSLMTGTAYKRSAELAAVVGPYEGYARNAEAHKRVMRKHAAANDSVRTFTPLDKDVHDVATAVWADVVALGEANGYRNSQASVLAPTGTIGLMMSCDTTGIEPDLALVKFKKMVGGGSLQIVNNTVPRALRKLGYTEETIEAIVEHIAQHGNVVDAPGLKTEHYPVFDCAMGVRTIAPMGHVRMMAATQPFLSGAISKCVTGDSLVATTDGLVRIGSWWDGEAADSFRDHVVEVASLGGTTKTDAFYYGGLRPTRRAVLRSGHRVVGTPNHRVLVAGDHGIDWRELSELTMGDYVAVRYGDDLWSATPASLRHISVSPRYGSQKAVNLPEEMSEELAFLLGAYASEGHTTLSTWTVTITNSQQNVLERVQAAWQSVFGLSARVVEQPGKCPGVVVASKAVVEFLRSLGCGERAANKRIPDVVLRSPKAMVLAFLQGLALDAFVTVDATCKWAISMDSPGLLDDLQAVLTNLGIVHGRIGKLNRSNGKTYDEVYACGAHAVDVIGLVPFLEADKAARATQLTATGRQQSTADVVPGINGRDLHALLPAGRPGRSGAGTGRQEFSFLLDPRTQHVSRRTLERVAALPGVNLPQWLRTVLSDNLHFTPVAEVVDDGPREVYDVSVPGTHAFVANGIVNHNTVNVPETATVDEIEEIYFQGWKLGLKALAIYRDNCKVGQPLSDAKGTSRDNGTKAEQAPKVEYRPTRKRLPKNRPATTTSFSVGGAEGYMTASRYPDDGLGEIFLKMSKQGSTLAGMMDAFSIAVSIGLQYGVPLETYVQKFVNMRFDPAGLTDDPDVRMAQSIMDYIFRRLALEYLPYESRAGLGIYTAEERTRYLETGSYEETESDLGDQDLETLAQSAPLVEPKPEAPHVAQPAPAEVHSSTELLEALQGTASDAPMCFTCGTKMRPAGSCYVCEGCGATSGCS